VQQNSSAYGFVQPGMRILKWNHVNISTIQDFKNVTNNTVQGTRSLVATNNGTYCLTAGKNGSYGILVLQKSYSFGQHVREVSKLNPLWNFFYNFIGLTFVLNILVGIVNLLPIPPFDGYRILSLKLGERKLFGRIKIMDTIIAIIVGAFLANLLPWGWM